MTSHIYNWVLFCFGSIPSFFLELFLHWSPAAYWAPTDLGSSSFSVLSFCLLILFMGFSRQESWSGLPFRPTVDHILSDLSTMTRWSWWPHMAWLSFTELDTTVVLWSDWLVFCDYGFSVSALWCPLTTPTVLLGFLLPWTWGISSQLLQQSAAATPYLGRGVSSHGCPSWPWTWGSSSPPSCTRAAAAPWRWGSSSLLPLPCCHSLVLSVATTVWITINCGKFWRRWEYQITWPASWETCMRSGSNS